MTRRFGALSLVSASFMALTLSGVMVKGRSGIELIFCIGTPEFQGRAAPGTDKPGLAAVARHGKTPVRADHDPRGLGKAQRVAPRGGASDLACLAPPDSVMAMARPDKGMRDLVKDGVANVACFGMADIMARKRNGAIGIVALTGAAARMVKLHCPAIKAVMTHELSSRVQRRLKRPFSWLHAVPAI